MASRASSVYWGVQVSLGPIFVDKSNPKGAFTVYTLEFQIEDATHVVKKRYRELLKFHERMIESGVLERAATAKAFELHFPSKTWLKDMTKPKNYEKRGQELLAYFRTLVSQPIILKSKQFQKGIGLGAVLQTKMTNVATGLQHRDKLTAASGALDAAPKVRVDSDEKKAALPSADKKVDCGDSQSESEKGKDALASARMLQQLLLLQSIESALQHSVDGVEADLIDVADVGSVHNAAYDLDDLRENEDEYKAIFADFRQFEHLCGRCPPPPQATSSLPLFEAALGDLAVGCRIHDEGLAAAETIGFCVVDALMDLCESG